MIILAVAGLYIFLSVETILTGVPLKTKNKEKIRLIAVDIDQDAVIPRTPHFILNIKKMIVDKFVKRPHKK